MHPSDTMGRRPRAASRAVVRLALTMLAALLGAAGLIADALSGEPPAVPAPATTVPTTPQRHAGLAAAQPWGEAFASIARQADAGSPRAAAMALDMVRHGPQVYGQAFPASAEQLRRWRLRRDCSVDGCGALG